MEIKIYEVQRDTAQFLCRRAFGGNDHVEYSDCQSFGGCGNFHGCSASCRFHPLARLPAELGEQSYPAVERRETISPISIARFRKKGADVINIDKDFQDSLQQYSTPWTVASAIAASIGEYVPRNKRFIDLGAGNGALSAALLCEGFSGDGIEVDLRAQCCQLEHFADLHHPCDGEYRAFTGSVNNIKDCFRHSYVRGAKGVDRIKEHPDERYDFAIMNPPFMKVCDFLAAAIEVTDTIFCLIPDSAYPIVEHFCVSRAFGVLPLDGYDFPLPFTRGHHTKVQHDLPCKLYLIFNRDTHSDGNTKLPVCHKPNTCDHDRCYEIHRDGTIDFTPGGGMTPALDRCQGVADIACVSMTKRPPLKVSNNEHTRLSTEQRAFYKKVRGHYLLNSKKFARSIKPQPNTDDVPVNKPSVFLPKAVSFMRQTNSLSPVIMNEHGWHGDYTTDKGEQPWIDRYDNDSVPLRFYKMEYLGENKYRTHYGQDKRSLLYIDTIGKPLILPQYSDVRAELSSNARRDICAAREGAIITCQLIESDVMPWINRNTPPKPKICHMFSYAESPLGKDPPAYAPSESAIPADAERSRPVVALRKSEFMSMTHEACLYINILGKCHIARSSGIPHLAPFDERKFRELTPDEIKNDKLKSVTFDPSLYLCSMEAEK